MTFKDFLTLSLGISGGLIGQLLSNYLDLCQRQSTSPQILTLIEKLLAREEVVISSLEDPKMERFLSIICNLSNFNNKIQKQKINLIEQDQRNGEIITHSCKLIQQILEEEKEDLRTIEKIIVEDKEPLDNFLFLIDKLLLKIMEHSLRLDLLQSYSRIISSDKEADDYLEESSSTYNLSRSSSIR